MLLKGIMLKIARMSVCCLLLLASILGGGPIMDGASIVAADAVESEIIAENPDRRSTVDNANGLKTERGEETQPPVEDDEMNKYIAGNAYAISSPVSKNIPTMTLRSAVDYDWILTYETGREEEYGKDDAVFYDRGGGTLLEPGAVAALGFGLGLFAIVFARKKK